MSTPTPAATALLRFATVSDLYAQSFYDRISSGSSRSAARVLPLLMDRFPVASAVDIGCGSASWLSTLKSLGCSDVVGVDGQWARGETLLISDTEFVECDLSKEWPSLDRKFDLAMSTEVAEHLPHERADGLVRLLCSLSDIVLFSAAIPQQGGVNHVNEQWPSYWAALFRKQGYGALDIVRPRVWADDSVEYWYRQNLLVYVRGAEDEAPMLDVVHPELVRNGLAKQHGTAYEYARVKTRPIRARARALRSKLDSVRK
jgi:hypothetical protein